MVLLTILSNLIVLSISNMYYFFSSSNLIGGDIFLDFALVAVIEAVADLINMFVIDHVGRKTNLVFV